MVVKFFIKNKILVIFFIAVLVITVTNEINAAEDDGYLIPFVYVEIIGERIIDLSSDNRFIRAFVEIEDYDPAHGHYFMEVYQVSTSRVVTTSEINPRQKSDDLWFTQIAYVVDEEQMGSSIDSIVGEYEIIVYNDFGDALGKDVFTIIEKPGAFPPVVSESPAPEESEDSPPNEIGSNSTDSEIEIQKGKTISQSDYDKLSKENEDLRKELEDLNSENKNLTSIVNELKTKIDQLNAIIVEQIQVIYKWVINS